jgi:hypothetical protein
VDSKYDSLWGGWCFNKVHGKVSGWVERFPSHIILEVGDDTRLDFGMTFGVGIRPKRKRFLFFFFPGIYIVLLALRMLP